jgi:uncharacterized protein with ParB-like and HNH nuclease domain
MNEILVLKSISDLLNESFFIPSYQRGYRWTEQQIVDLLEDINEFDRDVELDKNNGFYCLQPIVVKKSKSLDFKWDVIDGQQRLTTIFIILKSAETLLKEDNLEPYKIGYETRKKSQEFLQGKLEIDERYIDFFHMSKAFKIINTWFKDKKVKKSNFIKRLLQEPLLVDNIDKAKNVRVIWYEVEEKENHNIKQDIDIFTRINMGKIPLTNAELVKALLLEGFEKNEQFEIASQWDTVEYALQNDDFWLFINKEKNEQATRIEFIFELIATTYLKNDTQEILDFKGTLNKQIDTYYIFHIINHLLQNYKPKEDISVYLYLWEQVTNYFRILNEWYEDREFFHKIGFLIIYSKKDILSFIEHYSLKSKTKDDFRRFLDTEIQSLFESIDLINLKYEDKKTTKDDIRKTLLMFNILTIINNEKSNMKFQFDRYKDDNWDIEHIRSQTDKYPEKKDRIKWIDDNKKYIKQTQEEIKMMKDDEFKVFYQKLSEEIEGVVKGFDKDRIGNLALLDATTNRGYGNAFFATKRKIILENDTNGTFIPICTKNVFMKYYTADVKKFNQWTVADADDYEDRLEETLEIYLTKEVQ